MKRPTKLRTAIKRWRRRYRRAFPSPAERRFAELMGAVVITIPFVRSPKGYVLSLIIPRGWYAHNNIEREVPVWGYSIDFASRRLRRGFEIDGRGYHDIVTDQQRDEHLQRHRWVVKRIPAARLWKEPDKVRVEAARYLHNL